MQDSVPHRYLLDSAPHRYCRTRPPSPPKEKHNYLHFRLVRVVSVLEERERKEAIARDRFGAIEEGGVLSGFGKSYR